MPKLTQEEQINKLNFLTKLANSKKNGDLSDKLSAFIIYNGLVDFFAVQAARLLEQILLKAQLAENKKPSFQPNEDDFFYNEQVSTRRIIKEIRKFLPFHDLNNPNKDIEINGKIDCFLNTANQFLNYRNAIVHRIGSPNMSLDDVVSCCDKALAYYDEIQKTQKDMFEALQPYRFSQKELDYFYKI